MDHYNEQLVKKETEASDIAKKILIIAGTLLITGLCVYSVFVFGFLPLIVLVFGVFYLWIEMSGSQLTFNLIKISIIESSLYPANVKL